MTNRAAGRMDLYAGAGIFVLALAARVAYLAFWVQSPYYGFPLLDEQYHHDWAMRVALGLGYGDKPFFRAPLYPYFLGMVYRLSGDDPLMPRVIQAALGAGSALLVWLLGRRIASRGVAALAGAAAALYPVLIFFDGELLLPTLLVFLNLLFALALAAAWDCGAKRWWFAAGVFGGLSAITRPNILVPMMALGIIVLWRMRRTPRAMLATGALYALGAVLVIAPVTVRNRIAGGDWVLIASQGGIVLYAGNGPEADGFTPRQANLYTRLGAYEDSFEQYARIDAERALGRPLRPSEISRYWTRRTLEYVAENPAHTARLLARKMVGWWSRVEVRNNKTTEFALQFAPPILALHHVLNFVLIGPLALMGLAWGWRRKPLFAPLAILVLAYQASFLPFFVCDRYRVPMLPFYILFAAWMPFGVAEAVRARAWRTLGLAGIGLAAAAALVWVDWFDLSPQPADEDKFMLSIIHEQRGEMDEARQALLSAIAENPRHFSALHNLGRMAMAQGDLAGARRFFEASIAAFPRFATAYNSLGAVLMAQGEVAQARQAFEQSIDLDPENALAHSNLANLLEAQGESQSAESHRQRAAQLGWQ